MRWSLENAPLVRLEQKKWAAPVLAKDSDLLVAQKTRKKVNWPATAAGLLGLCPGWAVEKPLGTD